MGLGTVMLQPRIDAGLAVDVAEMDIIAAMLSAQFGDAHVDREQELVLLQVTSKAFLLAGA